MSNQDPFQVNLDIPPQTPRGSAIASPPPSDIDQSNFVIGPATPYVGPIVEDEPLFDQVSSNASTVQTSNTIAVTSNYPVQTHVGDQMLMPPPMQRFPPPTCTPPPPYSGPAPRVAHRYRPGRPNVAPNVTHNVAPNVAQRMPTNSWPIRPPPNMSSFNHMPVSSHQQQIYPNNGYFMQQPHTVPSPMRAPLMSHPIPNSASQFSAMNQTHMLQANNVPSVHHRPPGFQTIQRPQIYNVPAISMGQNHSMSNFSSANTVPAMTQQHLLQNNVTTAHNSNPTFQNVQQPQSSRNFQASQQQPIQPRIQNIEGQPNVNAQNFSNLQKCAEKIDKEFEQFTKKYPGLKETIISDDYQDYQDFDEKIQDQLTVQSNLMQEITNQIDLIQAGNPGNVSADRNFYAKWKNIEHQIENLIKENTRVNTEQWKSHMKMFGMENQQMLSKRPALTLRKDLPHNVMSMLNEYDALIFNITYFEKRLKEKNTAGFIDAIKTINRFDR